MTSATLTASNYAMPKPIRIGIIKRINTLLFGAPSFVGAHGGYRLPSHKEKTAKSTKQHEQLQIPVYKIAKQRKTKSGKLPKIWLSEAVDARAKSYPQKRAFVKYYPNCADTGGNKALELAECYFAEGLNIYGNDCESTRLQCFQAAELLYMHAMKRGNLQACTRLGMIYRFDMCKGQYLADKFLKSGKHAKMVSAEQTAFKLFRKAAMRGETEAMVLLAEMLQSGIGCQKNSRLGLGFYKSAVKNILNIASVDVFTWPFDRHNKNNLKNILDANLQHASIFGNAALGIAEAFEQGLGCVQSFEVARVWYEVAFEALSLAFDYGFWFSKRNKNKARMGYFRMLQEINGKY